MTADNKPATRANLIHLMHLIHLFYLIHALYLMSF
jgi:hypothetical protein